MQTTEHGRRSALALVLDGPRNRRVPIEGHVTPRLVVVRDETAASIGPPDAAEKARDRGRSDAAEHEDSMNTEP